MQSRQSQLRSVHAGRPMSAKEQTRFMSSLHESPLVGKNRRRVLALSPRQDSPQSAVSNMSNYKHRTDLQNFPATQYRHWPEEPADFSTFSQNELKPALHNQEELVRRLQEQVDFYEQSLASLRERTQLVVVENARLHKEREMVVAEKDFEPGQGGGVQKEQAGGYVSQLEPTISDGQGDQVVSTDTEDKQPKEKEDARVGNELEGSGKLETPSHRILVESVDPQMAERDGMLQDEDVDACQLQLSEGENHSGDLGLKMARVELELARSKNANTHLKEDLDMTNRSLVQAQNTILRLETKLSMNEDQFHKKESAWKAKAPTLCIECGHRQALLPPLHTESRRSAVQQLTRERTELVQWLTSLQQSLSAVRDREAQTATDMRRFAQVADELKSEKEQAERKRAELAAELGDVRQRSAADLRDAQQKAEEMLQRCKRDWAQDIHELQEKLSTFSAAELELKQQVESLARNNASVTNDLEMMNRENKQLKSTHEKMLQEAQNSLLEMKRVQHSKQQEIDRLEEGMRGTDRSHKQETSTLLERLESTRRRCDHLKAECRQHQEKSIALVEELGAVKRKLQDSEAAQKAAEESRALVTRLATDRLQQQMDDLAVQLQTVELQKAQNEGELQQLLASQRQVSEKWKAQCQSLASELEKTTAQLRSELSLVQEERTALCVRLEKAERQCQRLQQQNADTQKKCSAMERRIKAQDKECGHWQEQVVSLLTKQRDLLRERQELALQLMAATGRLDEQLLPSDKD